MLIIADANIPLAREAFSPFGEVRLLPGRDLAREHLRDAEVLIVRSVTKVNAALLDGTSVRFVGTATIGTDHLDIPYLDQHGIRWASAAGCNARSVVEWVLAALAEWCLAQGITWEGRTLGIVGHGNVGSRLAPVARALGMRVLVNDPPLQRAGVYPDAVPLDQLLAESDIVTLHVPYTKDGPDPTHHLIQGRQLGLMKHDALFLNASRGAVLCNKIALEAARINRPAMVLDVFEGEPRPNRDLVRACFLATPHIAGYSYEGKVMGTRMMAEALAAFLGTTSGWVPQLPAPDNPTVRLTATAGMAAIAEAIRVSYDIRADDGRLREGLAQDDEAWGKHFDALRKNYPQRREFANYHIPDGAAGGELRRVLVGAMGFGS
jgi:erythronate-4-phosphate dehydrogenase